MKFKVFLFILVMFSNSTFAHQDFWKVREYGNVVTRVLSGFDFEEVHKIEIIGQIAKNLCDSLGYTKTVILDFEHAYTHKVGNHYFVGIDNKWKNYSKNEPFDLEEHAIIVTNYSYSFNIVNLIKILEHSMQNESLIKRKQKFIEKDISSGYSYFELKTIDSDQIAKIIESEKSDLVESILNLKYYRATGIKRPLIKCYWSNENYSFEILRTSKSDSVIFTNDYFYAMQFFQEGAFLCISDSSFVFINANKPSVSLKHIIMDKAKIYASMPVQFVNLNRYNYASSFAFYDPDATTMEDAFKIKNRTLFYQVDEDRLIQYIEKEILKISK